MDHNLAEHAGACIRRFLPLTCLAPETVEAILDERATLLRLAKVLAIGR